jgi:hypothetical protein
MSQQPPYGRPPGDQGSPSGPPPYSPGPPPGSPPWQPPPQPWPQQQGPPQQGPPQQGPSPYPPPPYQQQYQQAPYPPQYYAPPPPQRQRGGVLGGIGIGCLIAVALVVIVLVVGAVLLVSFAHRATTAVATAANVAVARLATVGSSADVHVPLANGSVGTITSVEQEQKTHRVTITRISDNAKSTNPAEQPHAGNRYYALQVTVENVGSNDINAGPWTLYTSDGQEFNQVIVPGIGDPPNSSSLAPGGKTAGSIIFEIPATATVQSIRYAPNPHVPGNLWFDA